MELRRIRWLVVGALAALAVAAASLPAGTQTTTTTRETVAAVSGRAFGAEATVGIETEPPFGADGVEQLVEAVRDGDSETVAALLDDVGVALGDVTAEAFVTETVGPVPEVVLPPEGGGPFTDSLAALDLTIDGTTVPIVGALEVLTEGALGEQGNAHSSAVLTDVSPEGSNELFAVVADSITVDCSADLGAVVGTTTILGGEAGDPIPESPAPNTILLDANETISVPGGSISLSAFVIANEQTVGDRSIAVNGVRQTSLLTATPTGGAPVPILQSDATYGHVECGIIPGAVIEPTFTG